MVLEHVKVVNMFAVLLMTHHESINVQEVQYHYSGWISELLFQWGAKLCERESWEEAKILNYYRCIALWTTLKQV